ncbi:MAG TPA: permease [Bacteroidales bacterium]|nr:permease [Bacteroidales bacterium]
MKLQQNKRIQTIGAISIVLPILVLVYIFLIPIADFFVFGIGNFTAQTHLAQAIHFFIYDTIKILILLFIISSLMGIVNAYFPVERLRIFLTTKKMYGLQYVFASLFGAITPFCSCSSIPLFIGFVKGGIPLGVTFSYLITSPLVNEVAVAMFLGFFGIKATVIYAGSGILLGIIGGFILGTFKLERHLTPWVQDIQKQAANELQVWEHNHTPFIDRLPYIIHDGWAIVQKVLWYIIIGIALGAAMHGYVPQDFFTMYLAADSWYAIPLAVILAVPMYANAAGIVPVIQVFVAKGVPLGTALAFMMAVVGLSLPEATLLKKVMTFKLLGIFFGTVTISIILLGYFVRIFF